MAWLDVCRINFMTAVKKCVFQDGMTLKATFKKLSDESIIPIKTIERWYYEEMKKYDLKNEGNSEATENNEEKNNEENFGPPSPLICRACGLEADFNRAMKELSANFHFNVWEINSVELVNKKTNLTLFYDVHNPNGVGARLYLKRVMSADFDNSWETINIYDQQQYCNGFYDVFAACALKWNTTPRLEKSCAIKRRNELAN